jgi:hypothetical protein
VTAGRRPILTWEVRSKLRGRFQPFKKLRTTLPLGAEIHDANIEAAVDQAG